MLDDQTDGDARAGLLYHVNEGLSPSNTIYIDNAVDAIVSAIREDNAIGHALTISDDKIITWKDFFQVMQK